MLGSLGFAGFNLLSYAGLEHTHPQNAALIIALQPLITAHRPVADDAPGPDAGTRSSRWPSRCSASPS